MSESMSLNARIRNIAEKKKLRAQVILQNYMFERLLVRLSKSAYKDKFVLKGGILVAALIGLDNRATMDLDTTLRNLPLTEEAINAAFNDICAIECDDNVYFSITEILPIRDDDIYGGYKVKMRAKFDTTITPLSIDVSTGDIITPNAVSHMLTELFDSSKQFEVWCYNIETILAEKVETILWRGVFNTRPKDYYDVYILSTTQSYNKDIFKKALKSTAEHRGTTEQISKTEDIINSISSSPELRARWVKYAKEYTYAKEIKYDDIISQLQKILK